MSNVEIRPLFNRKPFLIDGRVLKHKAISGVERYSIEIANSLKSAMHDEIDIALPNSKNRWLQHIWEHTILPKKASNYKVLFCPANICPAIKPPRIKFVTTIHDLSFKYYPSSFSFGYKLYYNTFTPLTIKLSDMIITVSYFEKRMISARYPLIKEKINVIYSGVDSEFFKEETPEKENYILYVGNLSKRKNFEGLLDAFKRIYRLIDKKLIVAGMKPDIMKLDKRVRDLINEIPKEYIEFKGQTNDKPQLATLYRKAHAFVFPSFYESFGFPPLEAMACGCPVVVSNRGALPEICGDAALYVDPLNIDDICDKIIMLEKDDELRLKLIKKGKERSQKFSWQESAAKHMLLIKEFL